MNARRYFDLAVLFVLWLGTEHLEFLRKGRRISDLTDVHV